MARRSRKTSFHPLAWTDLFCSFLLLPLILAYLGAKLMFVFIKLMFMGMGVLVGGIFKGFLNV